MNYHTSNSLKGNILSVGDIFGVCSIGHLVEINCIENLGGCGGLWIFDQLGIDYPESFCKNYSPEGKVYVIEDMVFFKKDGFEELTAMAIALMGLSEEQGYDDEFEED